MAYYIYIKDNNIEAEVKLAEAIKNKVNGTGEFVYLDSSDGNVKSMPNTNQLGANVAAVYYAGTRSLLPSENYKMLSAQNRLILSLDLSGWDFEAATNMHNFLTDARNLRTLTLPDNMTLGNVTNMSSCFSSCESLRSLDMSKCTLANVTSMAYCFYGCGSLHALDTSKWTLANVTSMIQCFCGCGSLHRRIPRRGYLAARNVSSPLDNRRRQTSACPRPEERRGTRRLPRRSLRLRRRRREIPAASEPEKQLNVLNPCLQ